MPAAFRTLFSLAPILGALLFPNSLNYRDPSSDSRSLHLYTHSFYKYLLVPGTGNNAANGKDSQLLPSEPFT